MSAEFDSPHPHFASESEGSFEPDEEELFSLGCTDSMEEPPPLLSHTPEEDDEDEIDPNDPQYAGAVHRNVLLGMSAHAVGGSHTSRTRTALKYFLNFLNSMSHGELQDLCGHPEGVSVRQDDGTYLYAYFSFKLFDLFATFLANLDDINMPSTVTGHVSCLFNWLSRLVRDNHMPKYQFDIREVHKGINKYFESESLLHGKATSNPHYTPNEEDSDSITTLCFIHHEGNIKFAELCFFWASLFQFAGRVHESGLVHMKDHVKFLQVPEFHDEDEKVFGIDLSRWKTGMHNNPSLHVFPYKLEKVCRDWYFLFLYFLVLRPVSDDDPALFPEFYAKAKEDNQAKVEQKKSASKTSGLFSRLLRELRAKEIRRRADGNTSGLWNSKLSSHSGKKAISNLLDDTPYVKTTWVAG